MTTLTTAQVSALTPFVTVNTEAALFKSGGLFTNNVLAKSKTPLLKK
jgi:hypothetical protein